MAVSVLIVEDDRNIAQLLQMYLEKEGYAVTIAADGGQGLAKFRAIKPDLVLLDVMMPVMDGWAVCKAIRADSQTPIIMLTAKGETSDKVTGLKSGADDYITKPFEMREVLARIEAVLRRSGGVNTEKKSRRLAFDKLVIDMDAFELYVDGKKVAMRERGPVYTFRIPLKGEVKVEAVAGECRDVAVFRQAAKPDPTYKMSKKKAGGGNWT